jgi:hypothetical protein
MSKCRRPTVFFYLVVIRTRRRHLWTDAASGSSGIHAKVTKGNSDTTKIGISHPDDEKMLCSGKEKSASSYSVINQ